MSEIELHERLAKLEEKVEQIMLNHLPHIQGAIKRLSDRFWAVIILLVGTLVATVFDLLVNLVK